MMTSHREMNNVEIGWLASRGKHEQLLVLIGAWLTTNMPCEVRLDEHDDLALEEVRRWIEAEASGGAFVGLLDGDDGPIRACFENTGDAVRFKLSFP